MIDYGYIWLAQIDLATPDPLQLPPLGLPLLHHTPAEAKKDSCVVNYLNFSYFCISLYWIPFAITISALQ